MASAFQQTTSLFNPLQINNCIVWLDGNDKSTMFQDIAKTIPVTQAGQSIAAWVDKSSLGTTTVNLSGPATYPTLQANTVVSNKTAVNFNGTTQYLQFAPVGYPTGASPTTFFFIVNSPNGASSGIWVFYGFGSDKPFGQATTFGTLAQYRFDNGNLAADYYGPATGTVDTTAVTSVPTLMTAQYSGTAVSGWRNGNLFSGGSFASPYTYAANVGTNYGYIGVGVAGGALSQWYQGQIAEIIGYSRALSQTERQQVEGYLAWKWGTNSRLPTTHPFYYNTTYALNPIPQGAASNVGPYYQRPFQFVPPWKPTNIAGCTLWFDANDRTTMNLTGSNLDRWFSKGTLYASTTNISNTAYYSNFNGYPSIFFNSNAKLNVNPINYGSASGTTWITCATNISPLAGIPDAAVVLATNGAGAERSIRFNDPASFTIYSINSGTLRGVSGCNANGMRGFIDTPSYFAAYQNGLPATSNPTSVTYQAGTNQGFTIGQWNTGYLYGYIYELIVYNSALTVAQYQQVESYLAYKWGFQGSLALGLPVPSTLGIYSFPPMPNYPTQTYPTSVTCVKWFPNQLTGLVGWYDAADPTQVVTSGTAVTLWRDKSGQGNNTTLASGSPQYTAQLNKKAGIVFNGTTSYFVIPKIIDTNWSIFIVLTTTVTGPGAASQWWTGAGIFDAEVAGTQSDFGTSLYGSSFATGVGNPPTGDNTIISGTSINTGAGFICEFQRISATGYFENFINGTSQGSVTGGTGVRTAPTRIVIGALQTLPNGYYFNGSMYEIVVYNSYLSGQQREQVEGYLAWKWGLAGQLPAAHPYKLFPPAP